MKQIVFFFICFFIQARTDAQVLPTSDLSNKLTKDSLRAIINAQKRDTNEVNALSALSVQIMHLDLAPDSTATALAYSARGIELARNLNYLRGEADCLYCYSTAFFNSGNINQGVFYGLKALEKYGRIGDIRGVSETDLRLQGNYREMGDLENALSYELAGERLAEKYGLVARFAFPGHRLAPLFLGEIAQAYLDRKQIDSSFFYTQKALDQNELFFGTAWNFPFYLLGRIQTEKGLYPEALHTFRKALPLAVGNHFAWDTLQIFSGLSSLYLKMGSPDSAIYYGKIVWRNKDAGEPVYTLQTLDNLTFAYRQKSETDSAFKYLDLRDHYRDSLYNRERLLYIQHAAFDQKLKQQELIASQENDRQRLRFYLLAAGLLFILAAVILLWRNNIHRKRAYVLLEKQKKETDQQKLKTENALGELKNTQTQLIHSAKMASLGELTSGIAHEIQNPLNFINNFSEVNKDLLREMKEALDNGNSGEAKSIAGDIIANEEKIAHHGNRADAIVKAMQQHTRSSTGEKALTDINLLAEEYLNLSYRSIRSQSEFFVPTIRMEFDSQIGKINIVPQDLGRVFLNIYNNAFYSLLEKRNSEGSFFKPVLEVVTQKKVGQVRIIIRDNGNGIPENIKHKIFQPFFTTKPPGKGTGLGLSMSYDTIKSHGGDIAFNDSENGGAEFVIHIPS